MPEDANGRDDLILEDCSLDDVHEPDAEEALKDWILSEEEEEEEEVNTEAEITATNMSKKTVLQTPTGR